MGKKWRQLKYEDRLKIYAWLQDKTSVATIAKRLGVCRQTIYREIKRGEFVKRKTDYTESTVYDPYVAEEHYQKKLKERGRDLKIGSDLKLLHYIEKKIVDEKRSPAAALHEIKKEGKEFTVTLSTNTIYSYIKKGIFLNITMEDLPEKKKQHKKKKVKVQKRVQAGDSISQRPEHIDFREEFGHWEMDTVVGPQGKSKKVMLVLTERKTRKEIVYLMPDRKAQTVVKTLNMIERKYGERLFRDVFKTITVDLSKYNEFLLTIGTYPADQYRILSSTVIPKTALENMIGQDSNGYFQVRYSDYYWAGLDYLGNNKIRYRSSNNEGLATIWAR